jgi:hypothetical protein
MAVKPITADSAIGRLLLALRRGPHTAGLIDEQGGSLSAYLPALLKAGLAVKDDGEYRITEAGRAACPFRNPLAAKPATPEKFTMPMETGITHKDVLAVIKTAGTDGITRKALIDKLGAAPGSETMRLDAHVSYLAKKSPAVIFKPQQGHFIAVEFLGAAAPAPVTHGSALPSVDIDGVSLTVDHHDAADLATADLAKQMAQIGDIGVAEFDLESITMPEEAYFEATPRYAVAFPSDFHGSVDSAVAAAFENYESDSLKHAVIIACTPLGRIEVRPVFVPHPEGASCGAEAA